MSYPRGLIILYADSSSLPGVIIAKGSGSKWTHCGVTLGDGTALQCEATHGGVCILPEGSGDEHKTIDLKVMQTEVFIENLKLHTGDRYDFIGLFANPLWNMFHWDIGLRKHSWNCATFLASGLSEAVRLARHNKPLGAWCPSDFV